MHFELVSEITDVATIASGRAIRDLARLRRQHGACVELKTGAGESREERMASHGDIGGRVPGPWEPEKYYEAIRELIKHEDGLLNERIKILASLQTLLFGVVATFWTTNHLGVWILCAVGSAITISYGCDIHNAARALGNLRRLWPQHFGAARNDALPQGVPPSVGIDVFGKSAIFLPGNFLPWVFLILWFAVFVAWWKCG